MKRILKDDNGNIFSAEIISSIPNGFTDITDQLVLDEDSNGVDLNLIELEEVPEQPGVNPSPEQWTNGVDVVFDANDIPVVTDGQGNASLDPSWVYVAAVAEVPAVPAFLRGKKKSIADQTLRQKKMDKISLLREPLLKEADITIFKLEDDGLDASSWRVYRKALRDVTEPFKKVSGEWKVAVDSLIVEEFQFPAKPE